MSIAAYHTIVILTYKKIVQVYCIYGLNITPGQSLFIECIRSGTFR